MTKREEFDLEYAPEPGPAGAAGAAGAVDDGQDVDDVERRGPAGVLRGPLPWAGAAVVLVLIGLVVADSPPSAWQRGMVESIGTPTEQWFTELPAAPEQPARMWRTQEALIVTQSDRAHILDAASGEELWHLDGEALNCAQGEAEGAVTCASGGGGADTELLVLDPDGEGVSREPHPRLLIAAAAGSDLFTVTHHGGSMVLERQDSQGSVIWSADPGGPGLEGGVAGPWSSLAVAGDLLVGGQGFVHHVEDGTADLDLFSSNFPRPGDTSTEAWMLQDMSTGGYRYLTSDGSITDSVDRGHEFTYLDDDITSDVIVQRDEEEIRAYSQSTGQMLWEWGAGQQFGLLGRVDGVALVRSDRHTWALDERTGEPVWDQRLPAQPGRMLSDGDTLLMPSIAGGEGGELSLIGIELDHGTVRFEVAGAADQHRQMISWYAHDGDLAVVTDAGISMWSLT